MSDCEPRAAVRAALYAGERQTLDGLVATAGLDPAARAAISAEAEDLVTAVRARGTPSLMQAFLGEYGLDSLEGVALMCLAEALLRVPDAETIDALISDKIVPADWGRHLGRSSSSLVNASTWALLLTGRVLGEDDDEDLAELLRDAMRRLGEPVIRAAVGQAMREMGRRFVLGRSIEEAATRAGEREGEGYRHSYDMLGEAARTEADAKRYHLAYSHAISELASHCRAGDVRDNPGISVKLSALHPRFEQAQRDRVLAELVPRALSLAVLAKSADMGFNIDAEEADRLDLSLDVIEALAGDPALAGWHGFGVVVQAYGPRAAPLLDWLGALAARHRRRLMVAWSRALTGTRRSSGRKSWGWRVFRSSRPRRQPTFPTSPAPPSYWRCRTGSIRSSPPTTRIARPPCCTWRGEPRISSSSACTAWARRCTRS